MTTTVQTLSVQDQTPRISPRTGKPVRAYTRKRPYVLRPQNLPQPPTEEELARQQANALIAKARNLRAFGSEQPPDWPDCPHVPQYDPSEPGDLLLVPDRSRARVLLFLEKFAVSKRFNVAINAAQVQFWEVEHAKRVSKTYAAMYDAVYNSIISSRIADIETVIAADAAGEEPEQGRRRPDVRAAGLFLAANDQRYKAQSTGGGATVILDVHF